MSKLRTSLLLASLALAASAFADLSVDYLHSDSRTIFKDASQALSYHFAQWSGSLNYNDAGGQGLYLNSIEVAPGAGFDPSIHYDATAGTVGTTVGQYTLGNEIASGSFFDIGNIVELDTYSGATAADGIYDLNVLFRGGADAGATDLLKTWNLHIEVADKLDLTVTGDANAIDATHPTSHLTMTVKDNMAQDFVSTTWFEGGYSLPPSGASSLTGDFDFSQPWFNRTIAQGDSLTGGHSVWSANGTTVPGVYVGNNGVVGGLHNGDNYYVPMDSSSNILVRPVPEPTSLIAVGLGVVSLLRRRRA